jgi:hypothetical protein
MKYICIKDYYSIKDSLKIISTGQIITEKIITKVNIFKELNNGEFCRVIGNGTKYNGPDYAGYDNWIEVGINVGGYTMCPLIESEFNEHFLPLCVYRDIQIDEILN